MKQVKKSPSGSKEPNGDCKTSVVIVIPTYNESKNVPRLLRSIYGKRQGGLYAKENIDLNVLFVDDSSPDGTAEVIRQEQKKNPRIHLMVRQVKNGLGAAYVDGMKHAMEILNPDIIFEMDGDLSHNPKYIVPMIRTVRAGADVVIGSRYMAGGSVPSNWGIKRKLISRVANLYAKTILGLRGITDCTGGFRAIRASVLKSIDFSVLKTKGYAFQISLLVEMRRINAVIKEFPIAFKDRTTGVSKMRLFDMAEEARFVMTRGLANLSYAMILPFNPNQEDAKVRLHTGANPAEGYFLDDRLCRPLSIPGMTFVASQA